MAGETWMTFIQTWLSVILQILTLSTILISLIKIINRIEREWNQREDRLIAAERAIRVLETDARTITSVDVKLADMKDEISRLRNRLDAFLDIQTRRS